MKNKIIKCDFLIVGSGLIGSLCALAISKEKYRALVIEKKKIDHSFYKDKRTLAVNANSRDFLKTLNLWEESSSNYSDIKKILIKTFLSKDQLVFENSKETMGSVIYNSNLLKRAHQKLFKKKILIDDVSIDLKKLNKFKCIKVKNVEYQFKKIIISVGKEILKQLEAKNYIKGSSSQKAYVGFFNHNNSHHNSAYEYFTQSGPLAVLPAPNKKNLKSTFIFSTNTQINPTKMKSILNKNFKSTHGAITLSKNIYSFHINPHLLNKVKDLRELIFIGDSFRSIHPVAGQGWNLGIKDIQSLIRVLETGGINASQFNENFYAKRKAESYLYFLFTELINKSFKNKSTFSNIFGNASFKILNNSNFLKGIFIKTAMGKNQLMF